MTDPEIFIDITSFTGVLKTDNKISYYKNGNLHRDDGPAIEYSDGGKFWYKEGNLHREGGPAREYSNGNKEWWIEGNLHREDGPAVEYSNGQKGWYTKGKEIRFSDFVDHLVSDQDIFIGIENGYAKFLNSDEVTEIYCGFFIKEIEKEIKKIEKLKIVLELLQTKETK